MKIFLIVLLQICSLFGASQSYDWKISANKRFLPGASNIYQQYSPSSNGGVKYHLNQCVKNRNGKFNRRNKSKKVTNHNVADAFNFVLSHLNDSIYHLDLSLFDVDSLDRVYLNEHGFLTDSSIVLNFSLFERQRHKPIQSSCQDCLPIIYMQSRQIDGERLILNVEDTTNILNLNVGISETVPVQSFKQWMLFAEMHRKFELFEEINLDAYFSKEKIEEAVQLCVSLLKK